MVMHKDRARARGVPRPESSKGVLGMPCDGSKMPPRRGHGRWMPSFRVMLPRPSKTQGVAPKPGVDPNPTPRRGMATIEAVWLTAFMLPASVALFLLAIRGCRFLFTTNAKLVGWPLM
jgi:hypothetical protein